MVFFKKKIRTDDDTIKNARYRLRNAETVGTMIEQVKPEIEPADLLGLSKSLSYLGPVQDWHLVFLGTSNTCHPGLFVGSETEEWRNLNVKFR